MLVMMMNSAEIFAARRVARPWRGLVARWLTQVIEKGQSLRYLDSAGGF
jgi:hypothetical protein